MPLMDFLKLQGATFCITLHSIGESKLLLTSFPLFMPSRRVSSSLVSFKRKTKNMFGERLFIRYLYSTKNYFMQVATVPDPDFTQLLNITLTWTGDTM